MYMGMMKESVEDGEERIAQQQSLFHGSTSQWAENCRVLRLEKHCNKKYRLLSLK